MTSYALSERQTEMANELLMPVQRFGDLYLDSVQQMADAHWALLRTCNHALAHQWRDALQVRDAASLERFWQQRAEAARIVLDRSGYAAQKTSEMLETGVAITRQLAS
jgi:hypothetical protein